MLVDREIINFIGPEGAGKSTIAKKLAEVTNLPYVSVGDMLRDLAKNDNTELGEACRKMFQEHTYLEPNMLLRIQAEYLADERYKNGFILDGGLRTITEAEGFVKVLKTNSLEMPVTVLYLVVPREVSMERLTGEGGRKRDDDTIDGVQKRLERFYDNLDTRLLKIRENYELIEINATGDKEDVFQKVCDALKGRNK